MKKEGFLKVLPEGDFTPATYQLPLPSQREFALKPIRRWIYPLLNWGSDLWVRSYFKLINIRPDLFLWGQRGNDYERHRRRVNSLKKVQGSKILVAGCGTGRDVETWLDYNPQHIIGVDLFNYNRAWKMWQEKFKTNGYSTLVEFQQGDLSNLNQIPDNTFDIISSDAVLEHVVQMKPVLNEFRRILKPGGILYSSFGPLWYSWGGDHVSGFDQIENGFNHLLLKKESYKKYLDTMGDFSHDEHDGRTWIENDLFSKLRPQEYLDLLSSAGFKKRFISCIVDPKAYQCLENEELKIKLSSLGTYDDFIISAMTVIYEK